MKKSTRFFVHSWRQEFNLSAYDNLFTNRLLKLAGLGEKMKNINL